MTIIILINSYRYDQDPNYIATVADGATEVIILFLLTFIHCSWKIHICNENYKVLILDVRVPCIPVARFIVIMMMIIIAIK